MDASQKDAICRLDVEWAHEFNRERFGHPFLEGQSIVTGRWFSADENALMALHKLRTKLGDKAQRRESVEWLRARGLNGLREEQLEAH